jgi:hypothetical protein
MLIMKKIVKKTTVKKAQSGRKVNPAGGGNMENVVTKSVTKRPTGGTQTSTKTEYNYQGNTIVKKLDHKFVNPNAGYNDTVSSERHKVFMPPGTKTKDSHKFVIKKKP